jgi:hypothetical protein
LVGRGVHVCFADDLNKVIAKIGGLFFELGYCGFEFLGFE